MRATSGIILRKQQRRSQRSRVGHTCTPVKAAPLQLLDQDGADVALAVLQGEHNRRQRDEQRHGPGTPERAISQDASMKGDHFMAKSVMHQPPCVRVHAERADTAWRLA